MTDIVDKATRSRMMSGIKGKNTKPELLIRKALHAMGLRFRLHAADLPGKPDLVFPRYKSVIFVHGCFWHGHDCPYFKLPSTRTDFWAGKIGANRLRNERQIALLNEQGWRVKVVWECAIRDRSSFTGLVSHLHEWVIEGKNQISVEKRTNHKKNVY